MLQDTDRPQVTICCEIPLKTDYEQAYSLLRRQRRDGYLDELQMINLFALDVWMLGNAVKSMALSSIPDQTEAIKSKSHPKLKKFRRNYLFINPPRFDELSREYIPF